MVQKYNFIKAVDYSLQILYLLEDVFKNKIEFLKKGQGGSDSYSSLICTMKEEQQQELKVLQEIISVNVRLKQVFCKHPKKDKDVCDGEKYCMNCNLTLKI